MAGTNGRIGVAVAGLLAALILAGTLADGISSETLKISGTGGAIGGIKLVSEAFERANPGVKVVLPRSMGSSGGIRAAIAGKLDIGLSARPLTAEERATGGREVPYARTAFVFAVNPGVKQSNITLFEAVDIYGGKTDRWKDGTQVRLVLRPVSDTDTVHLERMSPQMAVALEQAHRREGLIVALTDHDCADVIEDTPGAFGTTTLAMVTSEKRNIKVLSLSGVAPSGDAVRDGSYPYAKTFRLVTGSNPSRAATKFIAFLRSPAGRSILDRAGHVPLP